MGCDLKDLQSVSCFTHSTPLFSGSIRNQAVCRKGTRSMMVLYGGIPPVRLKGYV
jgi:hypothetical protein